MSEEDIREDDREVEGKHVPDEADEPRELVEEHEDERERAHEQDVHDEIEKSKVRETEAEEIVNPDDAPNEAHEG